MFPAIDVDGDIHVLRPMTCPHHLLVYQQKPRSYRELPFRIAEHAILHRYESSGSLTGLERVRSMQLIDTHIICAENQIKDVVSRCYKIINEASSTFGVKIHSVDLALHDKNDTTDKFFKGEEM
jgi:threonyl-tRNA synthetase